MSSNRIGLQTPRGSGTSGHVQKNIAVAKIEGLREKRKREAAEEHRRMVRAKMTEARKVARAEIESHDQKRQIEVRCMELRESLEDEDLEDEEIDKRVALFRNSLLIEQKAHETKAVPKDESRRLAIEAKEESVKGLKQETKDVSALAVVEEQHETDSRVTDEVCENKGPAPVYDYIPRYDVR
ncbi:hypothetical protein METBIDRAFT_208436 [Metschnikowia bicuspidata var. bicuspidata NRRL YB-4993]|uniref:Pre-mRNA-splicing factor CWC21 n=1 Tax=Metschnikowia bicuspidata var. bicuspidata NRRL YB-4993 TaxID=869754 RepID=A0A1A0H7E2_9ASCO|nr:hypothetical protein METBIDRAFT_208436 [Metschnikowia bicuspidata var. bicuspidata NRRL YB-4993]OBA19818.1 hypothetical protein METBIDRAFT_208436 [Metschnikowia bicuspidata var. bicuspidata NRRL YB-4993]